MAALTQDYGLYEAACREWARGLSEQVMRSLISDYRSGDRSPEACDAVREYYRRERAGELRRPCLVERLAPLNIKGPRRRCEKHTTSRSPGQCMVCRKLNESPSASLIAPDSPMSDRSSDGSLGD